jgi:putative transposase
MLDVTTKLVKRAYRYRFYPDPAQAELLARTFGCVRLVYNKALAERSRLYSVEGRSTTYVDTAHWLTEWKQDPDLAFLRDVSNVPLQQALRNLQGSFSAFFAKRAKYPRFKSRHKSRASATFMGNAFTFRDGQLKLAKMSDPLDIVWSRPLPDGAVPSSVTVSRDPAGRWHVSILVEETIHQLPELDTAVGVDVGITALITLSTGEKIVNPKHERADRRKLAKTQRNLARKEKGSANRAKAKLAVARIHARIADRRRDHLHKLTTRLVRENQTVVIEDLSVRNMVRNHSLARAISDASWFELRRMLEYKADWYGRTVIAVDRWYPSSKLCSTCGHRVASMPLNVRAWTCPDCSTTHDRDVNAAKNLVAAGLAETQNACGGPVRPESRMRQRHSPAKQEPQQATAGIPRL